MDQLRVGDRVREKRPKHFGPGAILCVDRTTPGEMLRVSHGEWEAWVYRRDVEPLSLCRFVEEAVATGC